MFKIYKHVWLKHIVKKGKQRPNISINLRTGIRPTRRPQGESHTKCIRSVSLILLKLLQIQPFQPIFGTALMKRHLSSLQ